MRAEMRIEIDDREFAVTLEVDQGTPVVDLTIIAQRTMVGLLTNAGLNTQPPL